MRVITNRGVRTLTFAAAHALGAEEQKKLVDAEIGANLTCFYWEKNFTTVEKVLWKVDPAFHVIRERRRGIRQWQVLVKSLPSGSLLTVRTPDGSSVFVGRPSDSGTLHFSLMFADQDGPEELAMEFRDGGRTPESIDEMSMPPGVVLQVHPA